jgi:hypothetical protein
VINSLITKAFDLLDERESLRRDDKLHMEPFVVPYAEVAKEDKKGREAEKAKKKEGDKRTKGPKKPVRTQRTRILR